MEAAGRWWRGVQNLWMTGSGKNGVNLKSGGKKEKTWTNEPLVMQNHLNNIKVRAL
jgi:hypothetical protein